jgi:hypothetical protein
MVSSQIHVLELSVLWGVFGKQKMLELLQKNQPNFRETKDKSMIEGLKNLKSFLVQGLNVLTSNNDLTEPMYHGTSLWQKTLFILSQIGAFVDVFIVFCLL